MQKDLHKPQTFVEYSEDYFLSITLRLGKKTIYGWTLAKFIEWTGGGKKFGGQTVHMLKWTLY